MNKSYFYYLRSISKKQGSHKNSQRICEKCGNKWRGYPNERCPTCRESTKNKK